MIAYFGIRFQQNGPNEYQKMALKALREWKMSESGRLPGLESLLTFGTMSSRFRILLLALSEKGLIPKSVPLLFHIFFLNFPSETSFWM